MRSKFETLLTLAIGMGAMLQCDRPSGRSEAEPERTARGAAQSFPRAVTSVDPRVAARLGCTPGTYRCLAEKLEMCDPEQGWAQANVCQTSAHCNAAAGQCLVDPCILGEHQCNGKTLEECHANGWQASQDCGKPEKCNASAARCD
jgi:hypothetical protein